MKDLTRKDWELVKTQCEQERRTILITLEINTVTIDMLEKKIEALPKDDEPKNQKGQIPKRQPSSYVG